MKAVDYDDLYTAIDHFNEGHDLLLQTQPYVQFTPAAPIFDEYIESANEMSFRIRSGYVTIDDFRQYLSPLSNIVSSIFGSLAYRASSVIDGGFNAVFDDIDGMANGLNIASNALSHGDILGAIAGGIGSVIDGKLNAIGSLFNGFGDLFA